MDDVCKCPKNKDACYSSLFCKICSLFPNKNNNDNILGTPQEKEQQPQVSPYINLNETVSLTANNPIRRKSATR